MERHGREEAGLVEPRRDRKIDRMGSYAEFAAGREAGPIRKIAPARSGQGGGGGSGGGRV